MSSGISTRREQRRRLQKGGVYMGSLEWKVGVESESCGSCGRVDVGLLNPKKADLSVFRRIERQRQRERKTCVVLTVSYSSSSSPSSACFFFIFFCPFVRGTSTTLGWCFDFRASFFSFFLSDLSNAAICFSQADLVCSHG